MDTADVMVLAVSVLVLVLVGLAVRQAHRDARALADVREWTRPNGTGSLAQMSEDVLERVGAIERGLQRLEGSVRSMSLQTIDHDVRDAERHAEVQQRIADLTTDVVELSADVAVVTAHYGRFAAVHDGPNLDDSIWHSP